MPLVSKIDVPILGAVRVLLVKVWVPVSVTSPVAILYISGFVPSFAVANKIASLLSVAEKVCESP